MDLNRTAATDRTNSEDGNERFTFPLVGSMNDLMKSALQMGSEQHGSALSGNNLSRRSVDDTSRKENMYSVNSLYFYE